MVWNPKADKSTPASQQVKWDLVQHTRGRGLDVGCGAVKPFPHFIGIDVKEFHAGGMTIKPDFFQDATDLSLFAGHTMDFVFASHSLNHIKDWKKALREMWRVLKPWGRLIIYSPDKRLYTPGKEELNTFTPEDIIDEMKQYKGWNLIVNEERNAGDEYSFFQVFFKLKSDKQLYKYREPKPEKTACVVRYGAFGDMMQITPVLAGLKAQGYHVTLQSSPPGADVVAHDPHVDTMQLQDKDQVPNPELGEYWAWCRKKFDLFVNLSESVEGALLSEHERTKSRWPKDVRHQLLNFNYVETQLKIAGLAKKHPIRFYPTAEEKEWARKERAKMGRKVVMWSLAGSAIHKTWPYLDTVLARIMLHHPDTDVVLVGGPECEILEAGWDNEKRVKKTCGKWKIRESLAFTMEADIIIGPETGVMNASADLETPKIVFLSHSTVENLSRDWKNTVSLASKVTPCYPCHILHQSWELCKKDEEKGVAQCQSDISADECWEHINRLLSEDKRMAA